MIRTRNEFPPELGVYVLANGTVLLCSKLLKDIYEQDKDPDGFVENGKMMTTFKPTLESYNSHSGFLEKKSKKFRRWQQHFFVCEDRKLKRYSDETHQELIDELQLSPDTVVQTMPPEGERRNIFVLYNPRDEEEKLILNAQDATSLELWMIALIQGSQGEFQEEENFDTGQDLVSGDPHFDGMLKSVELTGATSEEPVLPREAAGKTEMSIKIGAFWEREQNSMKFRQERTFEDRLSESKRILSKYPDRIPVICEKRVNRSLFSDKLKDIDKKKYLVPGDLTCGQFIHVIRNRLKLPSDVAIYLYVNGTIPPTSKLLNSVYNEHKDPDGFVYITYCGDTFFGDQL